MLHRSDFACSYLVSPRGVARLSARVWLRMRLVLAICNLPS